jgi:hypothetical protein
MHAAQIPMGELIFHPHFEALEYYILGEFEHLGQPDVLEEALAMISKMSDQPAAPVLAYEYLKVALGMAGEVRLPALVADAQLAFMSANELWVRLREGPRDDDSDETPKAIDAAVVVERG